MNLQELQTIVQNKLKVKLVTISNNGYLLIRLTQLNFQ
jgi:thiamine pyrophosphate-dependent acetolactate synthase large subunit-like protein